MKRTIYITLLPLMLIGFVSESAPYMLIPSLPDMTTSLGLTKSQASGLLAIYYLTLSVTFLFVGGIGDRYNKKQLLLTATTSILTGSLLLGVGNTYPMLAGGRALQALGAGIVVVVAQTWIGQSSTQKNITRLFSYLTIVMSFAPMVAPIAGGFLNDTFGWRYNFYFVAALAIATIPFLLLSSPPSPGQTQPPKVFKSYKDLLFDTPFFAMTATMLVCFLFQGSLMSYSSFLFIEQLGLSPSVFGFISIPIVTGIIIGQFPVLWLEKRKGLKAAYTFNSVVIVVALLISIILEQTIGSLGMTLFIFNIGFGGHSLIATRTVITRFATMRSYSSALMNFLSDFTNYIAALLIQLLFFFIGTAAEIHNIVSSTTIILIILCYLFFRQKITELSVLHQQSDRGIFVAEINHK